MIGSWTTASQFTRQDFERDEEELHKFHSKNIKCLKCRHGNMEIMWDDTGMYYKCGRCGEEFPK